MPATRRTVAITSLTAIALTLVATVVTAAHSAPAGSTDTISDVGAAAKAGIARLQPSQAAMTDAMNVLSRMSSDATFQKTVLGFANKGDVAGLTTFVQKVSPNSTVSVSKVADFYVFFDFTVRGHTVSICVSNKDNCGTESATLRVS